MAPSEGTRMNWQGRKVLVTGGVGFLGAHLCKALVDLGADVVAADSVTDSPTLRVLGVTAPVILRNCASVGNMLYTLKEYRPTVIYHLAGQSHIAASQADPAKAFAMNVVGAYGVLEACRLYRDGGGVLDAVVLSSSNHVFGSLGSIADRPRAPFRESDALLPADMYGATKGCADLLARAYVSFGLPIVALRHLNAFGEADIHAAHLVTATMLSLLAGERPVIRSDGTPVKGYLYVGDLIAAYVAAAGIAREHPGPYNIGSVVEVRSVLALVEACIQAAGVDIVPDVRSEDLTQAGYVEMLNDRAFRSLTGWVPRVPLPEGLRRTYAWYKQHDGMAWVSTSGEGR